jgi:hypothetical protein
MRAGNQVGLELSYRSASPCSLATQFQTRFLESIPRSIADLSFRLRFPANESFGKNRFALISFGKIQFLPLDVRFSVHVVPPPYFLVAEVAILINSIEIESWLMCRRLL